MTYDFQLSKRRATPSQVRNQPISELRRVGENARSANWLSIMLSCLSAVVLATGCSKDAPLPADSKGSLTATNASADDFKAKQARAEQGDATAQFQLGMAYESGKNVPQSYIQAAKWFRKAAEQGHEKAQFNLGVMASLGRGMATNDAMAIEWWRKSADQGNARAQNNLGFAYANGRGAAQDFTEAAKWLGLAAEQGFAQAQFNLGGLYMDGKGVTTNLVEAYKWFSLAALQRYPGSDRYVVEVGAKLSGEEMADALREARTWRAAHPNVVLLPTNSVAARPSPFNPSAPWLPTTWVPPKTNAPPQTNTSDLTPVSLVPQRD